MKGSMIVTAMMNLDEEKVLTLVRHNLKSGVLPFDIIDEAREGINQIVKMYEQGKYFLSDLMMGSEIFSEVTQYLKIKNSIFSKTNLPPIIIGTVKNDIHDIGKNIMVQLLSCKGFNIIDLGVDVSPEAFAKAVLKNSSRIVCLSGLLTVSYESMRATVKELEKYNLRSNIEVIIGGMVNEEVRQFVGADYSSVDSADSIRICQNILINEHEIESKHIISC